MRIGDEVLIHGFVDEIRKDTVIIKNAGGYFGTVQDEIKEDQLDPLKAAEALQKYCINHNCSKCIFEDPEKGICKLFSSLPTGWKLKEKAESEE